MTEKEIDDLAGRVAAPQPCPQWGTSMVEHKDVVSWCEENLKLPAGSEQGPWTPSTVQRAIIEAMQEPCAQMRTLLPSDLQWAAGPTVADLLLYLEATSTSGV